jgi:aspartyl-tRNA(Asn)/glutamyl-tRNA(Gln) amidotransferase subunit A
MNMKARALSRREVLTLLAAGAAGPLLGTLGCTGGPNSESAFAGDPAQLQLSDAIRLMRARELSPVELTQACLDRIERFGPRLNAFVTVTAERAIAKARQAESEIASGGWRGPLHGVPVAIKDNIDTAGIRTTSGSALFESHVPSSDAEVVTRLEAAGAISLGKLNLHELGMGSTSAISRFGAVHNPWDLDRMAGGSSGGAAAAVAAHLCYGALGTDTGGSIRIPAACCGVVGLKPSYGVVSTHGVLPLSRSFDCVGPLARTVADTAWLFRTMTDHPVASAFDPEKPSPVSSMRVGVLDTAVATLCDRVADTEIQAAFDQALATLRPMVADIRPAVLPIPDLGEIVLAEAYQLHESALARTPDLFDPRTRDLLLSGRTTGPDGLERLHRELELYRASIHEAFLHVDVVVVPTLPEPPLPLREAVDPLAGAACTFVFNIAGLPALSMPCGFTRDGLPIALTIAGPPLAEPRLFALADAYERATSWHHRTPPLG